MAGGLGALFNGMNQGGEVEVNDDIEIISDKPPERNDTDWF